MKKTLALLAIILAFTACKQSAKGPNGVVYTNVAQYNDYIINRQLATLQSIKDMASHIGTNNSLALSMLSDIATKSLEDAKDIEGMPAWKENVNFRNKAVEMFKYYGTTYTTKFKELIQLINNPELTETQRAGLKDKGEAIDNEQEKMNQEFLDAQKEFSEANNLRLTKKDGN
jgi:hypothetical protein